MEQGSPTFSKSLKKKVFKQQEAARVDSINSREHILPSLRERFLLGDEYSTVLKFDKQVFFPVSFREALKRNYSLIVSLYEEAIDIHNSFIAGGRYPEDGFEWFNQPEISELQQKLRMNFSSIGKDLAYRKRRLTAVKAQLFLFQNVLKPLDEFTWYKGRHLEFFFEHAIDLLVQSFLSDFIGEYVSPPVDNNFSNPAKIDFEGFCQLPTEANFLNNQMELYNLRDYIVVEPCIIRVVNDIEVAKRNALSVTSSDDRANMIFDIFELIPLYVKSWDPNKNKIIINNDLAIFLFMEFGFPSFAIGKPEDNADIHTTSTYRFAWSVTHDFWCMAKQDCKIKELDILGDYVLSEYHDKLLSLYVLRKTQGNNNNGFDSLADFTFEYHSSLTSNDSEVVLDAGDTTIKKPIPSVTMSSFFDFMRKAFDCYIENGKGSEIKIWRKNSRIYTLGRHKKDQKIHSFIISKILKRLDISKKDWLEAFVRK